MYIYSLSLRSSLPPESSLKARFCTRYSDYTNTSTLSSTPYASSELVSPTRPHHPPLRLPLRLQTVHTCDLQTVHSATRPEACSRRYAILSPFQSCH